MQICIYDVVLSKKRGEQLVILRVYFILVLGAARCSLPKVLLIKFCGGLFLSFGSNPAQICTVCIGLIKMVHHRTYMKYSYGYGCSYHETLCKFREIAAATHREALMVSIAILTYLEHSHPTPSMTHSISGLKSRVLKLTFLA